MVEIPRGSRNKYEFDPELGAIKFDRFISASVVYPTDYGFVPETLALDGDELDVLVCVSEPTFPGCVVPVNPIGLFRMRDEKGPDDKVVCVPVQRPALERARDVEDLPQQLRDEIFHFFTVYKDLDATATPSRSGGWGDEPRRWATIAEAQERIARRRRLVEPLDVFHLELRQFPHVARVFNLTRDELDARFVRPWVGGADDRARRPPLGARAQPAEDPRGPRAARRRAGHGARLGQRHAQRRPTSPTRSRPGAPRRGGRPEVEALKAAIGEVAGTPLGFQDVMALAAAAHPQWRASQQLELAEQAVWEMLHQGRVVDDGRRRRWSRASAGSRWC